MEPTSELWSGVGTGIANSPGWMVVGALLVIGVLFVVARYVYPGHKELRMRELDIREREQQNDAERIKANAALAENMRGLRESNDLLAQQSAALAAGIEESKLRSRSMGDQVSAIEHAAAHTSETVDDTNAKVTDIHQRTRDIYNILNGRGQQ